MTFTGWKTRLNPSRPQQTFVDPNVDAKLTCIAVIDENDTWANWQMEIFWNQFRAQWPLRRFILLTPKPPGGTAGPNAELISDPGGFTPGSNPQVYLPTGFVTDPLAENYYVMRDGNTVSRRSDWFEASGIWKPEAEVKVALLFIDVSGSMTAETVTASTKLFVDKMVAADYRYKSVLNGDENWILPFQDTLNVFGTL